MTFLHHHITIPHLQCTQHVLFVVSDLFLHSWGQVLRPLHQTASYVCSKVVKVLQLSLRAGGRWGKMNVEHWKCVYTYVHHLDSPSHLEIHHPCFPLIPLLPPPPRLPRLLPPPPLLLLPLLLPHLSSPQCETWVHTVIWWTVHCSVDQLSDQHDALADPGQESNTMHVCVFVYTYWYGDWLHRGGWKLSVSGTTCTVTIAMPVCYALHFSHKKRLMTPV